MIQISFTIGIEIENEAEAIRIGIRVNNGSLLNSTMLLFSKESYRANYQRSEELQQCHEYFFLFEQWNLQNWKNLNATLEYFSLVKE